MLMPSIRSMLAVLAAGAAPVLASPATTPSATPPVAKPAASASATNKVGVNVPAAGGNGGGVSSNSGNTAGQISPKKPKCPDPTKGCPAEQVIAK